MIHPEMFFKSQPLQTERLAAYGFSQNGEEFLYTGILDLLPFRFELRFVGDTAKGASMRVFDLDTDEEYALIHTPGAVGAFVGSVTEACEAIFRDVVRSCFSDEVFTSVGARMLLEYAKHTYGDSPEFLWEKTPDNAILRRKDSGKWYAVLMTVSAKKIGFSEDRPIEVANFHDTAENVARLVDGITYFPGFHMNKKYWYTVRLDRIPEKTEFFRRIDISYALAKT